MRVKPGLDSVAVARLYVSNAKSVLDSLTALHFRRLEVSDLKVKLKTERQDAERLITQLAICKQETVTLLTDRANARADAAHQRSLKRRARLLNVCFSLAIGSYVAHKTGLLRWVFSF